MDRETRDITRVAPNPMEEQRCSDGHVITR
ncbi:hypothetical protein FB548_1759 [Pseudoxanthomonas sp. 3HH-4]|nr:hypothetical protein FB548_1759 [Pseudoxanthomonas sp. 3HH-4]